MSNLSLTDDFLPVTPQSSAFRGLPGRHHHNQVSVTFLLLDASMKIKEADVATDMATGEAEDERDEVADATTHADQPVNEPQTQTQAYQEPEHESEPEALRCRICDDPAPESEALIFINCGHTFCSGCLNECFRVGLSNKASFPPKCCENEGIDIATVAGFLEEELVVRYTMVEEEFRTRSPLFCATPRCSALISGARVANAVGKFIDCHECGQASCIDCKSSRSRHTEAKCPDFIDKEDRDLVNEKKWKQCPGCKNLVEREDGCNHMTCGCGTEFCYECGIEFADDNSCGCNTLPDDEGWHHPVAEDDDRDFDIDGNPIETSDVEDSDEP